MSIDELCDSLFRLSWHKSPSQNGVSPNTIKALNQPHRLKLLKLINVFLREETFYYLSWHSGAVTILPKKVIY